MNRLRATAIAVVALVMLAGCSDIARMVTPAGKTDLRPARVAFTASVSSASVRTSDELSLRVTSSYVQSNGTRVVIASQTIILSAAASQAVPIPVDLAACLADASRDGAGTDAGCSVVLDLSLVVNGTSVDRQTVGPLRLAAGATTAVSQPVTLFEIASIDLSPASALVMVQGATATINPLVRDTRGLTVAGRTPNWTSDAPTIASVDGSGKVTAINVGETRISATIGGVSNNILVRVTKPPVALALTATAGSGSGSVKSSPTGIDCRVSGAATTGTCSADFAADAQVTLTSTADAGQSFGAWGGACASSAAGVSCTVTMAQARAVTAQFSSMRRLTVVATSTDGRGRITGPFGIDCRIDGAAATGTCAADVVDGTPITLTNVPDAANGSTLAQMFAGWGGDCAAAAGTTCTVTLAGGNRSVTAGFQGAKSLTVQLAGTGGGGATTATGFTCARAAGQAIVTCASSLVFGAQVALVAEPDGQSTFIGWTGACNGPSTVCVTTMTAARAATATFTRRTFPLTMVLDGGGNGSVLVNGVVACSRTAGQVGAITCTTNIEIDTRVVVTLTTGDQTDIIGNAGACESIAGCEFVMNTARSLTTTFSSRAPVTVRIIGSASGTGLVRSDEAVPAINCRVVNGVPTGAGCSGSVPNGSTIRLQTTGDPGNALILWGGSCSGRGQSDCTLVARTNVDVVVGFTAAIDLELRLSGSGLGVVSFEPVGAPSQQPCAMTTTSGANCRFALPIGLSSVLRGQAANGARFDGFIGPCAESAVEGPVPVCTYRGIGFLRVFTATFSKP